MMKNQTGTADCGDQVYVITLDTAADGENLHDFLEQHDYDFFTVSEGSESFRHIQDAIPLPEVSAQQNDSASDFREESLPRTEAVAPQETQLSRADFHGNYDGILGESVGHLKVLEHIEMFAESSQTVLISGETGTGKELVATALHAQSHRVVHPMTVANCAGIADHLSEFFGHEKGAFTGADQQHIGLFETASGSTLFLDEIGELPRHLQPNLLRVLQEGSTDLELSTLPFPIGTPLKEIEKSAILETLARADGNRSKTAKILGISQPTLRAKLRAYNE